MKKQIAIILSALMASMPMTASAVCNAQTDNIVSVNNSTCTVSDLLSGNENCTYNLAPYSGSCNVQDLISGLQSSCPNVSFEGLSDCNSWQCIVDKFCQNSGNQNGDTPSEDNGNTLPDDNTQTPDDNVIPDDNGGNVIPDNGTDNTPTPEEPETPENNETSDVENKAYVDEVIRLVNQQRASNGLAALTSDSTLNSAASKRAVETVSSFSHTRPNGTSCFTVLDEFNYSYRSAGENIAMGQPSPEAVVTAWMNSEGHRANILGSFTKIGVGCHSNGGTLYWAQVFAS